MAAGDAVQPGNLSTVAGREKTLFGHPRGLTVLFLTQMWAEFSYFGLQAMLVYYMTGDLGFSQAKSSLIYGTYGATAFLSPFFGGIIADRWLGRTKSVIAGGALMMAGHFAMAFEPLLFPALALVAIGNGLFIPPLAVQVGSLYRERDPRQAQAFSAYYMGINLGGLTAPLVCGSLGEMLGWHWGFGAAGIGMAIGLIVYTRNLKLLPPEPMRPNASTPGDPKILSAIDWRNLRILGVMIFTIILFRVAYEQSGNVIALWVEHQTDRSLSLFGTGIEVPATWFQSINPALIILLTPFLMRHWQKRDRGESLTVLFRRMSIGCMVSSLSMAVMIGAALTLSSDGGQPVSMFWVLGYFVMLTLGELFVIPVGLSLIGRLSPVQIAAMLMGAWYLAKFVGSMLAGIMGAYWGIIPATVFFGTGMAALILAAVILAIMGQVHREK
ncbi:peptide MFS transporter [Stakelama pacifica]|uniref:POT family proton-dependent oligopeptide transporter n=1 Tax=Stakelama pacifica TaxID=517720 RepID=A0A4R6FYI7_9SPHN|nr:peptide MFS transporter [Stakelama pacifica]TDN87042.1 POT family proton-dependent oligopeptide transporter [Stakelama pacifica]GGO91433.1 MFS transporter [Stakelama pacifica]